MKNKFKPILKILGTKIKDINQYQSEYNVLEKEIRLLERKGINNASPFWRDKKYLYLISPMVEGVRDKKYIGNDPDKIKAALDEVENYKRWVICKERQKEITDDLNEFQLRLEPRHW